MAVPPRPSPRLRTGQTLRRRMAADLLDILDEAIEPLKEQIEESSEHQRVVVRSGWHSTTDTYAVLVICKECERKWERRIAAHRFQRGQRDSFLSPGHVVETEILPLFRMLLDTPCWGPRDKQRLAEWLTAQLVNAGAMGLPYVQLVQEAVVALGLPDVAPVETLLAEMEFKREWADVPGTTWRLPVVCLPVEHPLRTW